MNQKSETVTADRVVELKNEVCPFTFIKSKLAIEQMDPGQVLQVIVSHAPAAENVPRSFENEGHHILGVEQTDDHEWTITVRKKD